MFLVDGKDGDDDGTNAIALTSRWGAEDGVTDDCDIRLFTTRDDDSVWTFSANATPGSSEIDVSYVLAHEMGHCVGLGDQMASELVDSIMFASYAAGTEYLGLHAYDEEGAILIYGEL